MPDGGLHRTRCRLTFLVLVILLQGCDDTRAPTSGGEGDTEIRISRVEANQGVGIPIFADSLWIAPADRNAPLVANRPTLIWAHWEVGHGWEPRFVRAHLQITTPEGESRTLTRERWIDDRPSDFGSPERRLTWELPAVDARPGTGFQIRMEPSGTTESEVTVPSSPELIGFDEAGQVIRVTVVPIRHEYSGSCSEVPDLTEHDVETLGELLHRRSPTERVVMTLRDPFVWTESLASYGDLLGALSQLRFHDEALAGEYYAGLVHHCVRTGGQAIAIPSFPTRENGWTRTIVSAWRGFAPLSSTTFVHEMGHAQGRRHVRCTGMEGFPDPDYPHPDGKIGVWGYSIDLPDARMPGLSGNTYHPLEANDYMGYCTGPQHVSDYGWRMVHRFIREISGWDEDAASAEAVVRTEPSVLGRLLVGMIDPDGSEQWFEVPGASPDGELIMPGRHSFEVIVDGVAARLPVREGTHGQEGGRLIVVELPVPLARIEAMSRTEHGVTRVLDRERIRPFESRH